MSAFASGDAIVLAQNAASASTLYAYQLNDGGLAHKLTVTAPQPIGGFATSGGSESSVAFSDQSFFELDLRRRILKRLWSAPYHILGATWTQPPACATRQLLVLTAETIDGEHPLRSHLYLLDPDDMGNARLLSPESGYNFWHVSAGDVDGDGKPEVALCTWSYTARDPKYARRFFVYSWDAEGDLYPRWRGSRLCRPYQWAELADINADGVAELVSVEIGLKGGELICAYEWNQFGFWGLGRTQEYAAVSAPQFGDLNGDGAAEIISIITEADGVRWPCAFSHGDSAWRLSHRGPALAAEEAIVVVSCNTRSEGPPEAETLVIECLRVETGPARLRPIRLTECEGSAEDES